MLWLSSNPVISCKLHLALSKTKRTTDFDCEK
jgi:hypothetical protein